MYFKIFQTSQNGSILSEYQFRDLKSSLFLYGPIPASFLFIFVFSHYNFNTNWLKHRWCAWDSNLGPQDGRRRRNHGAMAATQKKKSSLLKWYCTSFAKLYCLCVESLRTIVIAATNRSIFFSLVTTSTSISCPTCCTCTSSRTGKMGSSRWSRQSR